MLPRVLDAAGVRRAVLVGHSDGGSIAAIHAGAVRDPRVAGVVLIAAHFFVEDLNIASIAAIKANYEQGDLRARLARYHRDVDVAFRGWNDAWLDPRFRAFDITEQVCATSQVPVLALQGDGRSVWHRGAASRAGAHRDVVRCETRLIAGARHAPHLEARQATLDAIVPFVRSVPDGGGGMIDFQTDPSRYRHWRLAFDGPVATLTMDVDPAAGLFEGCELKLNSYDLGVDIELADAVQRLRFEHPEVRCVVLRSGKEGVFCAGANIRMLAKAIARPQGEFLQVHQRDAAGDRGCQREFRPALARGGERQRRRRRLRTGDGRGTYHADRRPPLRCGVAGTAAARGAAGHRRTDAADRQAQGAARPRRRVLHDRGRRARPSRRRMAAGGRSGAAVGVGGEAA